MSALVVDTSVWIAFFRGTRLDGLEQALEAGVVVLSPVVIAELLSAPLTTAQRRKLVDFLGDLPLVPVPFEHWVRVGELRSALARKGLSISTPDAHIAQCSLDGGGPLWSLDAVFSRVAKQTALVLYQRT